MLTLEFLRFGAMYILWKALMLVITYYLIKRNPDSSVASGLSTVAV